MTVTKAMRELRQVYAMTQQEFAAYLGRGIATVVRWESTRPPKGAWLLLFSTLAGDNRRLDLALVFSDALQDEALGLLPGKTRLKKRASA